jgi:hypothetical protein
MGSLRERRGYPRGWGTIRMLLDEAEAQIRAAVLAYPPRTRSALLRVIMAPQTNGRKRSAGSTRSHMAKRAAA